jgi:hypothetical protein
MTKFVMVEAAFHASATFIPDGNFPVDTWREAVTDRIFVSIVTKEEIPVFIQGLEHGS